MTEKNYKGARRHKGITLFDGVLPREAVGNSRLVTGAERDEVLVMCRLLGTEPELSFADLKEIRRINDRIYSVTRSGTADPIVEELTPFNTPTLDKGQ